MPTKLRASAITSGTAPLWCEDVEDCDPDPPDPPPVAPAAAVSVGGELGRNVPVAAAEIQVLAALAAAEDLLGASELTVPLPPKLHDCGFLLFASKNSLMTKDNLVAVGSRLSLHPMYNAKQLTRITGLNIPVDTRGATSGNVVAAQRHLAEKTTSQVDKVSDDLIDDCAIVRLGFELTAQRLL
jgi:hypothetical protein